MAINKKLIHFKTRQKFNEELAKGNILDTSIVFILDTTEIYTHKLFYDGSAFDPSNLEESILSLINNKVDKVSGKGLSTNDYTTTEKNKLASIASGAEVNVQSDWNVTDTNSDAYIKNKPIIDSALSTTSSNAILNKVVTAGINAKYTKPSDGIPKSDLDGAVLNSLNKADTALLSYTEKYTGTYSKPNGGIPKSDLSTAVQSSLDKADTALQSYTEIYTGTYSKPDGGIPKTDLQLAVQTSLGKADTALLSYTETDPIFSASVAATINSSDINNWNGKASTSVASTTANGLMSNTDKSKLDGIAAGATANIGTITEIKMNGESKGTTGVVDLGTIITAHQDISGKLDKTTASNTYATKTELSSKHAFAKVSDGTTTITADATDDTLTVVAGSGTSIALDSTNDKLTISHSDTSTLSGAYGPTANVTGSNNATIVVPQITVDGFGHVTGVTNRTYTSKDTDTKVTSVGNHYTPEANDDAALNAASGSLTNITGTSGKLNVVTGLQRDAKGHIVGVISANIYSTDNNTTYDAATQSAAGLMSANDKKKLDGIATGANNYTYTLPSAGSSLGGVKSGGDVSISDGIITVSDDSHNHVISNVDGLQDALDTKAPLASPTFTGTPKAPTAAASTNSTQVATTAFVQTAVSAAKSLTTFMEGVSKVSSVASVPVTYRLVIATVSASASLSLASIPSAGREIHMLIHNTGSSQITITIPNSGNYINTLSSNAMPIKAGTYGEVNLISDGSKVYIKYS